MSRVATTRTLTRQAPHLTPGARRAQGAGLVLAAVGDPDANRTVTSIIVLLVALGVILVVLAVWLRRATRPDPRSLAPLELMGQRRWRRSDPVWQRRSLDEVRPRVAQPSRPSNAPPDVETDLDADLDTDLDTDLDADRAGSRFDDLDQTRWSDPEGRPRRVVEAPLDADRDQA